MVWENTASGSHIPAKSKRVVSKRQGGKCINLDHRVCTGDIDEYDHVVNIKSLRIERSHANDPALLQGLCTPCHKLKTQQEAYQARWGNRIRKPAQHPGLKAPEETQPGKPLVTPSLSRESVTLLRTTPISPPGRRKA